MNDYDFGNYLYQLRTEKELSQFQLGSLLGVSDKAVSKWENGVSKPKIEVLIKLAQIFNISVDELLTKKRIDCFEDNFYSNKNLWISLYGDITEKYGDNPPYTIYNRYLSEYYAFISTNHEAIIYLKLLKSVKDELHKNGEFFKAEGFINSLFIPYIMGITNINPLSPHYYCPNCKRVEFHSELYTGWDLPEKVCKCGKQMIRDGHNMPFEAANQLHLNSSSNHYKLLVSKNSIEKVVNMICDSFDGKMTVIRDENSTYPTVIVNNNNIGENEKNKALIKKPYTTTISIRTAKVADNITEIERKTGIPIANINFDDKCLKYIFENPKNEYVKNLIRDLKPECFADFIKTESFTRSEGIWENHKKYILQNEISREKIIAYREDVFDYILKQTTDKNKGFALEMMYVVSRGRFINGIPENILNNLKEINAEQWFIDIIQSIKFLDSKSFGVSQAQFELAYAWYKINYPEITDTIFP